MNVKRFKVIIVLYVVIFILVCVFMPYNAYITVEDNYHNLGFVFRPAYQDKYENNVRLQYRTGGYYEIRSGSFDGEFIKSEKFNSQELGTIRYDLNMLMLISELLGFTVLFAAASYVLCKRK